MANADSDNPFFSALKQTFQSWMNSDRVRVVGSQGRSLQVHSGDRLVIGNQSWIVQKRSSGEVPNDAERMRITYELRSEASDAANAPCGILEVIIRKDGSSAHQATLRQGAQESLVRDEDITILSRDDHHA